MAEYFSVELSQKVKRGMALTAQKCEFTGAGVPLGYKIEDKKYVIEPKTAPIVNRIFELYLGGKTMAEIIRYLNENGIKTSKGNPYNKSSIRRILENKRYLGIYTYNDMEIPGGVPQIIDDKTFADAQILLEKNKKAPARFKVLEENYLLSTKNFCAYCGAALVGDSGHSKNGTIHQYYRCAALRKNGGCEKKTVRKGYLEDLVIDETMKILTPERIDDLSRSIEERCEKERNTETLKRLQKLIRENETATANLVKSLEAGRATDVIYAQIEKRQNEKADLEAQLAREKIQRPTLKYEQMKFFFEKFTKGDPNDITFRQMLVDILIGHTKLANDYIEIYFNANDTHTKHPISENQCSDMGRVVTSAFPKANSSASRKRWGWRCGLSNYIKCCYTENHLALHF
jgi:hypothetical protein